MVLGLVFDIARWFGLQKSICAAPLSTDGQKWKRRLVNRETCPNVFKSTLICTSYLLFTVSTWALGCPCLLIPDREAYKESGTVPVFSRRKEGQKLRFFCFLTSAIIWTGQLECIKHLSGSLVRCPITWCGWFGALANGFRDISIFDDF